MNRFSVRHASRAGVLPFLFLAGTVLAQGRPDLTGMYSDPRRLEDFLCFFWCTDIGVARLNELLDDPANDDRSVIDLYVEAAFYQFDEYVRPHLSAAGAETLGRDLADDPGFLYCEPWAFAWEIFAPHQMQITEHDDHLELLYGEWAATRTVYMDGRSVPADVEPSAMGYSVGHYEGDALVIETTALSENLAPWGTGFFFAGAYFDGRHSDQLSAVERYTKSSDGQRLLLEVTFDDPWALNRPLTLKKVWNWAPDQVIGPYEDCEIPTEYSFGVN